MTICDLCDQEVQNRKEIEFHSSKKNWTPMKLCKICRDSLQVDFLTCAKCRLAESDEAVTKQKAQYCIDCLKKNCKNSASARCSEIRKIANKLIKRLEEIENFSIECAKCSFAEDKDYVNKLTINQVIDLIDECEKCKKPNKKALDNLKQKIPKIPKF
jgi:hypothetical protein